MWRKKKEKEARQEPRASWIKKNGINPFMLGTPGIAPGSKGKGVHGQR